MKLKAKIPGVEMDLAKDLYYTSLNFTQKKAVQTYGYRSSKQFNPTLRPCYSFNTLQPGLIKVKIRFVNKIPNQVYKLINSESRPVQAKSGLINSSPSCKHLS